MSAEKWILKCNKAAPDAIPMLAGSRTALSGKTRKLRMFQSVMDIEKEKNHKNSSNKNVPIKNERFCCAVQ